MKLIIKINDVTRIYKDTEWNEYIVKVKGRSSDEWYHTDCKQDAINTARAMIALPSYN
tara:strand:+ start:712 stop:885 length:174 start_codon:yes stop_codon:yes gene_type:complete